MRVELSDHVGQQGPLAADDRCEARVDRMLAEYLRLWGLRDPVMIAAQCRSWVGQAQADCRERPERDGSIEPLSRAALAKAMDTMDAWLDRLVHLVAPKPTDQEGRRGLLAMELPKLLDQYPEALLQDETLPDPLWQQLHRAARPVVPAAQRTQMHPQPLGELAPPLQRHWWRCLFGRIAMALRLRRDEQS